MLHLSPRGDTPTSRAQLQAKEYAFQLFEIDGHRLEGYAWAIREEDAMLGVAAFRSEPVIGLEKKNKAMSTF